jgi:hypothetical protein
MNLNYPHLCRKGYQASGTNKKRLGTVPSLFPIIHLLRHVEFTLW